MTEPQRPLAVVVMAAGKGTRMKTDLPKVLVPVAGRPMLAHVLEAAAPLKAARTVVVVGYRRELVTEAFAGTGVSFAVQEPQLGTGHAVAQAGDGLAGFDGDVMVLSGDVPLLRTQTLTRLAERHRESGAALTLLSCILPDGAAYGRILRNPDGSVAGIVEYKDATPEQREVREITVGLYLFDARFLFGSLTRIGNDNAQGEYYLTDLINLAVADGLRVEAVVADDPAEVQGANTVDEVRELETALSARSRL